MSDRERFIISGPVPSEYQLLTMLNDVGTHGCTHNWLWSKNDPGPIVRQPDSDGVAERFRCSGCGEVVVIERRRSILRGVHDV